MEDQDNSHQQHYSTDDRDASSENEDQNQVTESNDTNSGSYESNSDDEDQPYEESGSENEQSTEGSDNANSGSDSESGSSSESEEEQDTTQPKPFTPRPPPGAPPPNVDRRSLRKSKMANGPRPPPGPPPKQSALPNRPHPPPGAPPKNVNRKSLRKARMENHPFPPPGAPPSSTQTRQPHPPSTPPPQPNQPHPPPGAPPSQTTKPHPPSGPPPSQHKELPKESQPLSHPSHSHAKDTHPPTTHPSHPPSHPHAPSNPSQHPQPQHAQPSPQQRPPSHPSSISAGMTVIALFSFKSKGGTFSSGDRDIDMNAQDIMTVLHDFGNGWIKVDLKGVQGLVPTTYVRPYGGGPTTGGAPPRAKVVGAPPPPTKVTQPTTPRPGTPPTFQHHSDKQTLDPPRPSSPYSGVRKQHSLDSIALSARSNSSTVETNHLPLVRSTSLDFDEEEVPLENSSQEERPDRPPVQRAWSSDDARPRTAVPEHHHHYTDPVDTPQPVSRGPPPARRPLQSSAPTVLQQNTPAPRAEPSRGAPLPVSRGMSRVTSDSILLPQTISSPPPSRASFAPPPGAKMHSPSFSRSAPEVPPIILDELYSNVAASEVPPIVSQTIDYLDSLALDSPGLFRESASATELKRLKQMYDSKMEVDLSDIRDPNLVAGLLKLYFRELNPAIFPTKLNKQFVDAAGIENEEERIARMKDLMQEVPDPNFRILSYLFAHLRRVAAHSQTNKMTPSNLGICWGPTLFRTGSQMTSVVQVIIEMYPHLFL